MRQSKLDLVVLPRALEPSPLILNIGSHKLLVRLREINDSLNETDNAADATRNAGDHDLNDALSRVTQNEFVNSKATQQDAANTCDQLFVRALSFPVYHWSLIDRLHGLIATTHGTKSTLTSRTELGQIIILRATFCAISHCSLFLA